jgi:hypothetical protein
VTRRGSEVIHKNVGQHRGVFALRVPTTLPFLMPATRAFGAGRLFGLIILVFLLILAAFIVPLELRLRRQRQTARRQGHSPTDRDRA